VPDKRLHQRGLHVWRHRGLPERLRLCPNGAGGVRVRRRTDRDTVRGQPRLSAAQCLSQPDRRQRYLLAAVPELITGID
jgi:hypothetical protein